MPEQKYSVHSNFKEHYQQKIITYTYHYDADKHDHYCGYDELMNCLGMLVTQNGFQFQLQQCVYNTFSLSRLIGQLIFSLKLP